jgi:NAD(P)-dependent dehydrogenase (short-subunit alcohol dehydrogenase family)
VEPLVLAMDELRGKVAFITGAASGIGLGLARACMEAGMRVAMTDVDTKALAEAATVVGTSRLPVLALPLDVTDEPSWALAADQVEAGLGPVQLLCNNAGVSALGITVELLEPLYWNRIVDTNLTSVFNGVH